MARLGSGDIFGIWAGMVMCWDKDYSFDSEAYASGIAQMIKHKPHGIYTTGSTGEFYAIDFDEFKLMVDIEADLCGKAGIRLQIGCCSDATHKTLRLFEYCASKKEVGAAQVALPYWMELNDREVIAFFRDLYSACPKLPIVHYNIPRCKRFLHAADYLKILEVCPSLVGVKYTFAGSNFGSLQSDILQTPMLSYFVAEHFLASAMQFGAKGSYSSIICTNPSFMQKFYSLAAAGKWNEAMKMQTFLARYFTQLGSIISKTDEGDADPVIDKAMAVASGFARCHQRCRAPYIGWKDENIAVLRDWMRSNYPELVYAG
jgi:dihydrodipicolinate synthase/N-acetylneuraminate lyase